MADGKLTITIDGDEAKAHAAYINLTKDQKDLVAEIGKMGIAAEAAADKSIKAAQAESNERKIQIRMADALVKQNETLTQAYDRQKASLDAALSAGKISSEQYKQTLDSLQKKVHEGSVEFQQASREKQEQVKLENAILADQLKVAENIVRKTQSVTDKFNEQKAALEAAHTAGKLTFDEYQKGLAHITDEAAKANGELIDFSAATEEGVGQKSLGKITEFAAKFATIAAAVGVVKKALEFYNAEKEKAMGSSNSLADVRVQMRQQSDGDLNQMEARSEELTKFGLTRVEGKQLVADAKAGGFYGQEDLVAKMKAVIPLQESTVLSGTFREYFKDEAMGIEQSFNAALRGAAIHAAGIKEMIPQLATAATGRIAGGESSDVIASVAEMSKVIGFSAGEQMRNLGVALATNEKTKGMNMIDAMKLVSKDDALRGEITGGNSVMQATVSSYIKKLPDIIKADKAVEKAVDESGTGKSLMKLKIAESVDESTYVGRVEKARQDAIAMESAEEFQREKKFSQDAFEGKRAKSKVNKESIESGDDVVVSGIKAATASSLNWLGFSPSSVEFFSKGVGSLAKDGREIEGITNRKLDAELDDRNAKIRLANIVRQKIDAGEDSQKINQLLEKNGNLSIDELKKYEGLEEKIPVYADPRDNPRSINIPPADSAQSPKPASTGKMRVLFLNGQNFTVEEGSKEEAEIQARQREYDRQRREAERSGVNDPALLNESRSQTSAIERQTSTLTKAIERQTAAIENMNQFTGV
jgi:hypothetical protein